MINRALKLLRNYHNFKQKDLAKILGLSPSHLSEIEAGTKPVSYELLQKYADAFKMHVSSITFFAEMSESQNRDTVNSLQTKITDKALKLMEWLETVTRLNDKPPQQNSKAGTH